MCVLILGWTALYFASALDNRDFCCVASQFEVEPRARVIIFDLGKYEVENALSQRRSMSKMVSPAVEPLRTRSREHTGLLSWPESFYKEIEHHQSTSRTDKQPTSFSARALQLSMYGSMVSRVIRFWFQLWCSPSVYKFQNFSPLNFISCKIQVPLVYCLKLNLMSINRHSNLESQTLSCRRTV